MSKRKVVTEKRWGIRLRGGSMLRAVSGELVTWDSRAGATANLENDEHAIRVTLTYEVPK